MTSFRRKFPASKYPFSDALCSFWDKHKEAFQSLKLSNLNRFAVIPVIFTSRTPYPHEKCKDEVIGIWYLDKQKNIFKQDFIVNVKGKHKEFISYSANNNNGKYVRPLKEFFEKYGANGKFYHDGKRWQHHYRNLEDLPDEPNLKRLAKEILTTQSS